MTLITRRRLFQLATAALVVRPVQAFAAPNPFRRLGQGVRQLGLRFTDLHTSGRRAAGAIDAMGKSVGYGLSTSAQMLISMASGSRCCRISCFCSAVNRSTGETPEAPIDDS